MEFATYTPDLVVVSFAGGTITGYAKDTFIEVEREEDTFMKYVGALGDVARSRSLNKTGKITITLMEISASNDFLYSFAALDELDNSAVSSFEVVDLNGNMRCRASIAWVMKWPKIERGKESTTTQWVIECADLEIIPGGHGVIETFGV